MIRFGKLYDITIRLGVESASWPGDPPYCRTLRAALARGDVADVSLLTMTCHVGTHIDTPAHFLPGGRRLDDYRAEDFILACRVVEVGDAPAATAEHVASCGLLKGEAVLFKTRNSTSGRIAQGRFFDDGVCVAADAADLCLHRGARLVGIDYYTVDAGGSREFPIHRALMSAGVLVLETVNLAGVPAGEYTLVCLPLRLAGAEASPVRAVLLR